MYQLHAIGEVLKGLSEREIEKEEESINDLELALSDAEKGGMDNELSWMVGSYVYIKKEEKEKALVSLNKLEKSQLLDKPEIEAVAEIKKYMEGRENDKALNKLSDKIAFGKILYNLIKNQAEQSKQMQQIKAGEEGKRFFELHNQSLIKYLWGNN